MGIVKHVDFDHYLNRVRVHDQDHLLRYVAQAAAPQSSVSASLMRDVCKKRAAGGGISSENGVAIFDLTSRFVKKPVSIVATLEAGMDMNAPDNKPVDVVIAVLSPASNVSSHLQHLSAIARLFRSKELYKALHEARSVDEMKVLFMPTQDWMVAA